MVTQKKNENTRMRMRKNDECAEIMKMNKKLKTMRGGS